MIRGLRTLLVINLARGSIVTGPIYRLPLRANQRCQSLLLIYLAY
jgi:hypothetical protein